VTVTVVVMTAPATTTDVKEITLMATEKMMIQVTIIIATPFATVGVDNPDQAMFGQVLSR
jgi:hypothetical protein